MNLTPKFRKKVMDFFKKRGYGYRCGKCDRNARITEVYTSAFGFDFVQFRCPGCKDRWVHELKNKEIRSLT